MKTINTAEVFDSWLGCHHTRRAKRNPIEKVMKALKGIILLFLWWCGSALAAPNDVITERAWMEDPTGRMTLEQVTAAPQQALSGSYFGQGFSASAFWIRLRIDPAKLPDAKPEDLMVIRLRPVFIDEFELHDPLSPKGQVHYTGDLHPWAQDGYQSLNNNFLIPLGKAPRDVWLRLKTSSATLSSIEVLALKKAQEIDWGQVVWAAVYLAALLICMGWGLLSWAASRDPLVMRYVVREVFMLAYAFILLGGWRTWGGDWLSPEWIDWSSNLVFCTSGPALLWFDIHFFQKFQPKPLLLKAMKLMLLCFSSAIVMALIGQAQLALRIHAMTAATSAALVVLTVLTLRVLPSSDAADAVIPKWAVVCAYLFMMLLGGSNRLVATGVLPGTYDAFYLVLLYPLAASLFMMALLQLRANHMRKAQQEAQVKVQLAQRQTQEERDRREEQERFLAMLGHELRNPLAAVGMLADEHTEEGQQIRRAVSDMTQVLERSVQSSRLADARFVPEIGELDMHTLMHALCQRSDRVDLNNFAPGTLLHSDRMYLQIALGNLVDNALKYSPTDSRVQVTCMQLPLQGQETLRVRVSNAPGTAGWPDPQHIFEKYYRSPQAHHQIGAGLGLYLTKSLLQLLDARIAYLPSSEAQASRVVFEVDIPRSSHGA